MADIDAAPGPTPTPEPPFVASRWLRAYARLARWMLLGASGVWLVVALVWALLHGVIVPRIGDLKPTLEAQASQLLGQQVRIGEVQARSSGLLPTFEALDVTLLSPQAQPVLRLERVLFTLSPTSLLRGAFAQIFIDRPSVEVRRAADGQWFVAGLPVQGSGDGALSDWLFSNAEVLVERGELRWIDEVRGAAEPLVLSQVKLVLRNSLQRHQFRLDATPEADWGEPFSLRGQFRQPLLSLREGNWSEWSGTMYAQFSHLDLQRWRHHLPQHPALEVLQGQGWARAWLDIRHGAVVGATTDVSLQQMQVRSPQAPQGLDIDSLQGRLNARPWGSGFEIYTDGLQLKSGDNASWAGGRWRLAWSPAHAAQPAQGEWQIDQVELAGLLRSALRLAPSQTWLEQLQARQLAGVVKDLKAQWQGSWPNIDQYRIQGQAQALALQVLRGKPAPGQPAWPGLRGAQVQFDLGHEGGQAHLNIAQGAIELPAGLEDPVVALNDLSADVQWKRERDGWSVQVARGKLSNADLSGEFQLGWSSPATGSKPQAWGPLDLQASIKRIDARQLARYLPTALNEGVRHYLRDALTQGSADNVKLRLRGNLEDFPFTDPRRGEFRVSAQLNRVGYAYSTGPASARTSAPQSAHDWPALVDLGGELVIDREALQIKSAKARLAGAPNLPWTGLEASISKLSDPVVEVRGETRGPLGEALRLIQTSALNRLLSQSLEKSSASGTADIKLRLSLPIQTLDKSRVSGQLIFNGNDLNILPQAPSLQRTRGSLQFSENGFVLQGVQARTLGGDAKLEGGLRWQTPAGEAPLQLRIQGFASVEGLRQHPEWSGLGNAWSLLEGGAAYNAVVQWRQGLPDLVVTSSLQGISILAPAPLGKSADSAQMLKLEYGLTPETASAAPSRWQDQIQLAVGTALNVRVLRDIGGASSRVLRGSVALGQAAQDGAVLPATGVGLRVRLEELDIDLWSRWLDKVGGVGSGAGSAASEYLPSALALSAQRVTSDGRTLHNVVVGATRQGELWRANLSADELNGYSEYRPASGQQPARLYARLARLVIPPSAVSQVDSLLSDQPTSMPALDIVVNELELRGKRLGRAEIDAVNRTSASGSREWQLNKLNVSNPDASFNARGSWQASGPQSTRRTQLDFTLDIQDSGELLGRMGTPGLVRQGKGRLAGQVGWVGSPMSPDYASMNGQFNIQIERGQFLKSEPGAARLFGVLNLQALPRRLMLDFRDVFSEGFAFDAFRGDVTIQQGMASTNNLQMKGVNAAVMMEGRADIARETQDVKVVVVPEFNAGTASLFYGTINPVLGLTSYLAQYFLSRPLVKATTQEFHVSGSWTDPQVKKVD